MRNCGTGSGEARFTALMRIAHRKALLELVEQLKTIQASPESSHPRSPLGIYLEALNFFVFQQGDEVSGKVGKDTWDAPGA